MEKTNCNLFQVYKLNCILTVCKDILKMLRDKINRMNKQCSKREGGVDGWMDG